MAYPDEQDGVDLDAVLPVQFAGQFDGLTPARRLFLAVLIDALNRLRHKKWQEETRRWIASTDTSWPCTFESLCDALGLDAGTLRRQLLSRAVAHIRRPQHRDRTITRSRAA